MPLLRLTHITLAFGHHPLLQDAHLQLDAGERVGLLGRNGEGKSTLLKIIGGQLQPDHGEVWRQPGLRLAYLEQAPALPAGATVYQAVADGLGQAGAWLSRYHALSLNPQPGPAELEALGELQHQLDAHDGWLLEQRVQTVLSRLGLNGGQAVAGLSGGWLRRVALGRALVANPQVLLLDEPTNHLDLDSIAWLEGLLLNFDGAVLFVTHDRAFLQKLATRIVDLDRGKLTAWPGQYAHYLRLKAAALADEDKHNALFDKKLAAEETWIRQGIKARRTRNEGRVRALAELRRQRALRRTSQGGGKLTLERGQASGKQVITVDNLCFGYGGRPIIHNFSTTIQRGDKIGLIGANGAGKSTLLRLLLKQLQPTAGSVRHGTGLDIAYFDQLREQLDLSATVAHTIADGGDFVEIGGQQRHVISYLADFLFAPARARSPVGSLSGGEKNRLLLARLFTRPANLIVMDEPTNDLDIETLELLEEKLLQYDGTLLLVSHDRAFLDNVATCLLVLDGSGAVHEWVGGHSDWLAHGHPQQATTPPPPAAAKPPPPAAAQPPNKKKLSHREQQELHNLPAAIEALEARLAELNQAISGHGFYKQAPAAIQAALDALARTQAELERAYQRWEALDALGP